jgi:hypothetical protein
MSTTSNTDPNQPSSPQNQQSSNTDQNNSTSTTGQNQPSVVITQLSLNETIVEPGIEIINQQGQTNDGKEITKTTFETTDPTFDPQITEQLIETVDVTTPSYNDTNNNSESANVLSEIKLYASQITCSDFHGKGSIDDYAELFKTAANIANESKQMTLDVDIDGFNDFGRAADDLSELFNGYIIKLQNVSIISDISFLRSILESLKKIVNLSNIFGRFKQTILLTSTIQIPKSAHETKNVLENVMSELNCAINYINYFVDPTSFGNNLPDAKLSDAERNAIDKAVVTIENWNILAEQGVSIAMSNNPDIQYINQANNDIKSKTTILRNVTNTLKTKLSILNEMKLN